MRLRTFIPFVLLIGVLLVAACAPVTPVIPQTGPDTQGTVMPGDSGQGGTGTGQGGTGTNQGGSGTNQGGTTGGNQGGTGTGGTGTGGTGTGNNQGGTGTGGTGTGGTGTGGTSTGNNQGGTGGSGGQGGLGSGNTAPSPSGSQNNLDQNLQNAISGFVTQQSGGANGDVEILFAQQVDFQNGCLGLTNQGETCSQAVTPGWQVVARSNGNLYVIHTDFNGNNVRWNQNADANAIMGSGTGTGNNNQGGTGTGGTGTGGTGTGNNQGGTGGTGTGGTGTGNNQGGQSGGTGTGTGNNQGGQSGGTGGTGGSGGNMGGSGSNGGSNQGGGANGGGLRVGLDQVINLASQFLGQTLNVPVNQVSFSGVTVETWSDSCLGVGQANESCAQVTTPGYRITFNVSGQNYELRTDSSGSNMRLVQGGQQ